MFTSRPVIAETHRHAMLVFKRRCLQTLKGMSDFDILDKIGVVPNYDKELDKGIAKR
jgi:hypothetical protein